MSDSCDPMDSIQQGFCIHGIFQARIVEWAVISTPGHLPDLGIKPASLESPALVGRFFTTVSPGSPREKHNGNLESNIFKSCIVYKHLCDLPVPGCV